jgi:hypothetical protein
LQIIFGLHAVAGELGVTRQALVLFEELRRIAALAIVLTVTRLPAEITSTTTALATATAPAAALSLIDQAFKSLLSRSCVPSRHEKQGRRREASAPDPLVPVLVRLSA